MLTIDRHAAVIFGNRTKCATHWGRFQAAWTRPSVECSAISASISRRPRSCGTLMARNIFAPTCDCDGELGEALAPNARAMTFHESAGTGRAQFPTRAMTIKRRLAADRSTSFDVRATFVRHHLGPAPHYGAVRWPSSIVFHM
jgi:hypothetical protein